MMKKRNDPRVPSYAIRQLGASDPPRALAHLLALDAADRVLRFGVATDDAAIARYVDSIAFDSQAALGAIDADGALIGFAHVPVIGNVAELGLSVTRGHRRRGVALALAAAALRAAERAGAGEFRFHSAASNDGMRRLAQQLGMALDVEGSELIARRLLGSEAAAA